MKNLIYLLLSLATAIAIGFGLSYFSLERGIVVGAEHIGPWEAWPAEGSTTPDPYTQAHIARDGGLQLARAEGVTFVARTDSSGEPLTRACTYRITGASPVAAFWTLTATDEEGRLVTAPGASEYLISTRIARENDGSTVTHVGPLLAPGNWLETQGNGPLRIVLRAYDSSILSGISTFEGALPSIVPERCA